MKKLLLIPALLSSLAMATEYNYELTPLVGYNFVGGSLPLEDYGVIGAELQYNGFTFPIKPEISIFYSMPDYKKNLPGYADVADTTVVRVAANGVYDFEAFDSFTPFAKAGVGYTGMDDPYAESDTGAYIDAGAGVKIPFTDTLALKLEALYMIQYNNETYDGNLGIYAGLTFAFGEKGKKTAPKAAPAPTKAPIAAAAVATSVVAAAAIVEKDDDKDGVSNANDKCPNTSSNIKKVDANGCASLVNMKVGFGFNSFEVTQDNYNHVEDFVLFMKDNSSYKANVIGHTDSIGSNRFNQVLSVKRAKATKALMVTKGIDASRITTEGKGETSPVATNKTKEGQAQNRRIEVEVIK